MLEKYNIDKPPEHEFYAISFFFDSAVDQGAIKSKPLSKHLLPLLSKPY